MGKSKPAVWNPDKALEGVFCPTAQDKIKRRTPAGSSLAGVLLFCTNLTQPTGSVQLVQHYPKTTPVIFWSLSILISLMTERQSVRFSSRVKVS